MKLTVQDGQRAVIISDPETRYSAETLADWTKQAALLLAEQNYPPIPGGSTALVERAEQFDHDTREPIGFGGKR